MENTHDIPWYNPVKAAAHALKHAFCFSGRATRAEFWWLMALWALLAAVSYFTVEPLAWLESLAAWLPVLLVSAVLGFVALCSITCAVRRLRDSGLSGRWILLPLLTGLAYGAYNALCSFITPDSLLVCLNISALALSALVALATLLLLCRPTRAER